VNPAVHRRAEARLDLLQHFVYIGEDNVDAAKRFLTATHEACRLLARMPGMGALREFKSPKAAGLRSWPIKGFENYLIFYLKTDTGIDVVRVLHGARDLDRIFE
jgi:toxin ParE1/3/4